MRRSTVLTWCAALLAACGTAQGIEGPGSSDVLFVRTAAGLSALPVAGGAPRTLPGGVASFDLGTLATTEWGDDSTTLKRLSPRGEQLASATLEGRLRARLVSGSGELVALTASEDGGDVYMPAPRPRTRIVVVDETGREARYALNGNFEPEAFSTDDRELFMIEYVPPLAPERYRVRRLRLRDGRVLPIGRLKLNAPGQMQGTGRTQVHSPGGEELYTLYTQQDDAGHAAEDHGSEAHAFVHVLNLEDSWAHCIDLPQVFGRGSASASAITTDPYGLNVFVVDWTHGVVASLNPSKVRVRETAHLHLGDPDEQTFATATDDRLFVGGNDEVVVIDTEDMQIVDRWNMDGEVIGLRTSRDRERVYVATPGRVTAIDLDGNDLFGFDAPGATGFEEVWQP
ncbi:MAG TPA: hypothetical protein VG929_11315 [Actinomycetota bacterium]|nr:hypothetical protein [Actinomycetota bacterium]